MTDQASITGRCLCGKVDYSITAEPVRMGQCHCTDCQKSSGTGHMVNAFFPKDSVNINGETSSYTTIADNGAEVTRHFCPECGSRLYGESNAIKTIMAFPVGCMDDNSWYKPQFIVYHKRKQDWDFVDESLPTFGEMPPASPAK